jgi:hypothetical protein
MKMTTDGGGTRNGVVKKQATATLSRPYAPNYEQEEAAYMRAIKNQDARVQPVATATQYTAPAQPTVPRTNAPAVAPATESAMNWGAGGGFSAPAVSAYQSQYGSQIQATLDKILNREKFSYDFNADPLYRQYRDRYTQQGQSAMNDAIAQAAALTGGYGSSYGQQVGQQTYQGYMDQLNDIIPQLQGEAYNRYSNEGTELNNSLSLLQGLDDSAYSRFSSDREYQLALTQMAQEQANWEAQMALKQQGSSGGGGGGGSTKKITPTTTTPTAAESSAAWNIIAQNVANKGASQGRAAYNAAVDAGLVRDTPENRKKMLNMEKTDRVR